MLKLERHVESSDGSLKVLWKLHDGHTIESVILPRQLKQRKMVEPWISGFAGRVGLPLNAQVKLPKESGGETPAQSGAERYTACLSSQVGCAMACDFCLTGKQGFTRNLTAQEIIGQVSGLKKFRSIHNLVFMGMGEPLQNIDEVVKAIQFLKSPKGLNLSKRKITVSTSGVIANLPKLAETGVKLAISLNATTDRVRSKIMPINRKHPIKDLIAAAKKYAVQTKQTVMVEYVLLHGMNDSEADRERLYELTRDWDCKVNLIPYNPFLLPGMPPGAYERPDPFDVKAFQHSLVSRGVTATVRYSGGDDVSAACGQLQSLNAPIRRGFTLQQ